jgi:hypothetical protein
MRDQTDHLLIQGNFAPAQKSRVLRVSARICSLLLCLLIFGALSIYGVKVHFEDDINKLARHTRDLNEQNKELQVKLNHIRSYKNVETAAIQVPHLHMPPTVLDVPISPQYKLPAMPRESKEFPRVYGY